MRTLLIFCLPSLLFAADARLNISAKQPLFFEPNLGQTDANVRFLARGPGYMAWITDHELVIRPNGATPTRLEFARPAAKPRTGKGIDQQSGISSYFNGDDENKWTRNVPSYSRALIENVYPGIDIVFYEGNRSIEYDFVVKPGADPSQISVLFDPASKPLKEANGDITWDAGRYRHSVPKVYQGSRTVAHGVRFVKNELRFDVGNYDADRELVIDPVVNLGFFQVQGLKDDRGMGVATDSTGAVYVTGTTTSTNFPYSNPGGQLLGYSDPISTFVTKVNASGEIVYSVYIGSPVGYTGASKIAVDRFGSAYVGIWLSGSGFPLKRAFQTIQKGGQDLYIARIGASRTVSGYDLDYATYLGGVSDEFLRGIAVNADGDVFVTGETKSVDFPVINAARQSNRGAEDGFAAMISGTPSPDGTLQPVVFSITFGGSLADTPTCIAVDSFGSVYIAGQTLSNNFPMRQAHRSKKAAIAGITFDNFVVKLAKPSAVLPYDLEYSSFVGSGLVTNVTGIAADSGGAVYLTGWAGYAPLTPLRALDTDGPGYLLKIAAAPQQDIYPLEISSHVQLNPETINLDRFGSAYLTGRVSFLPVGLQEDKYFPLLDSATLPGTPAVSYTGSLKLNVSGTGPIRVDYGTLLSNLSSVAASALDLTGNLYAVLTFPFSGPATADVLVAKVGTAPSDNRVIIQSNIPGAGFTTSGVGCDGGQYVTPKGFNWSPGTQCTIQFATELPRDTVNNPPKEKYLFGSWADTGSVVLSRTIVVSVAPANYTAIYDPAGIVEVSVPGGGGTVDYPRGVYFRKGRTVQISATPRAGYVFGYWGGNYSAQFHTLKSSEVAQITSYGSAIRLDAYFAPEIVGSTKLQFVPLPPCRVLDTRSNSAPLGAKVDRDIAMRGTCGLPPSAQAYSLNVTVVPKGPLGFLTMYPSGTTRPTVSLLNALDGRVKANATILPAGTDGKISAYATDASELIVDVNGYFTTATTDSLVFYPVRPCRVIDTRSLANAPSLQALAPRTISVTGSTCGVPTTARAFVLNATVVPKTRLGFLRLSPTGTQPSNTSTLNALTGTVVANMAIVPAGNNGSVDAYATEATDLILDISGYFAPPGSPGALHYFPISPCRGVDTRIPGHGSPQLQDGILRSYFNYSAGQNGTCTGLQTTSIKGYSINATVWPQNADPLDPRTPVFGYLTLYNFSEGQPLVSTLNAVDGALTSNSAITEGTTITGFGSDYAFILIDITGYFSP